MKKPDIIAILNVQLRDPKFAEKYPDLTDGEVKKCKAGKPPWSVVSQILEEAFAAQPVDESPANEIAEIERLSVELETYATILSPDKRDGLQIPTSREDWMEVVSAAFS